MNKYIPTVMFDRSGFSGKIKDMHKADLDNLCKENKIIINMTPLFLEETIKGVTDAKHVPFLLDELEYIRMIFSGQYYHDLTDVIKKEIEGDIGLGYEYDSIESFHQTIDNWINRGKASNLVKHFNMLREKQGIQIRKQEPIYKRMWDMRDDDKYRKYGKYESCLKEEYEEFSIKALVG